MAQPIVTVADNITLVTLQNIPSDIGYISSVFEKIASFGINVDMISVTPPQGALTSLSFTISDEDLGRLLELTAGLRLDNDQIKPIVSSGNCKINILDKEMEVTPGFAAKVFTAARDAGSDIRIITTSEIQISLLVTEAAFDSTLEAIQKVLL